MGDDEYKFTPATSYSGDVEFTFNVTDGNGGSVIASQKLTVGEIQESEIQALQAQLSSHKLVCYPKQHLCSKHRMKFLKSRS